jgi:hypothetical protein
MPKPAEPVAASSNATTGQEKSVAPEGEAKDEAKPAAAEQSAAKTTGSHIMVLPPARDGDWNARGEEAAAAQGATKSGLFGSAGSLRWLRSWRWQRLLA